MKTAQSATIHDPTNCPPGPAHLLIYGGLWAESFLIRECNWDILLRTNEFTGLTVIGIGGAVQPFGGGFIDFVFPGYRFQALNPPGRCVGK